MSQTNSNEKTAMLAKIGTINEVEGFDPSLLVVDYTDLSTGEVRKRLPVMIQIAWFRMKYPEGKISVSAVPNGDCFVATARIYTTYKNGENEFLAEATASRAHAEDNPSVSPREWAQTAAIGVALRNAGFGLQFAIAGEDFSDLAPNELGESQKPVQVPTTNSTVTQSTVKPETEMTLEERYKQAIKMVCPLKKFEGRTLGDVMQLEPAFLTWVVDKYPGENKKLKEAARTICEYAKKQAAA